MAKRADGRTDDEQREIRLIPSFVRSQPGSVLIETGNTRVLCTVSVDRKQPRWMPQGSNQGWVTAEYNMLPNSSQQRIKRERHGPSGRTQEIQRLIGRSLRAAVDLNKTGPCTITIDCDVLEADGGTRTASISGAFVCLIHALNVLKKEKRIVRIPVYGHLAAVSVGKVGGRLLCDLDYSEDSTAEVDCNIVALSGQRLVEVQATAEDGAFSQGQMNDMVSLGLKALENMYAKQTECLQAMGIEELTPVSI